MSAPVSDRPPVVEERPAGSRWRTLLVIAVITAVVVGGGWWMTRPVMDGGSGTGIAAVRIEGASVAPRVGTTAPDFTATTTDGRTLTLSELRGQPVWLQFGATWCGPCRVEAPDVQAAHQRTGIRIVAVYLGEDAPAIDPFTRSLGLTYTHIPDPERRLAAAWGVNGIPVHWFIDSSGTIRATQVGILGPDRIAELLAPLS